MTRIMFKLNSKKDDEDELSSSFEWLRMIITTIFVISIYFAFSIGLTFYQRWFLKNFDIPLTTVATHLFAKFFLAWFCRTVYRFCTRERRVTLSWSTSFSKLAPTGFSGGLDIALSNWGLSLITVSLYTMTKSTSIISVLIFALLLKLEEKSWSILLIVGMISSGLFLFTFKSTQFDLHGFLLVLSASALSGLRWTTTQFIMQKSKLGLENPIDLMYYIQPWMLTLIVPLAFMIESEQTAKVWTEADCNELIILLLCGVLIAFFLEISEYLVLLRTSSLTMGVTGIVKEICTLVLAYILNKDRMSSINFLGLVICLVGVIGHIVYKTNQFNAFHNVNPNGEELVRFLSMPTNSSDEDDADNDDDSSTEVLFNVLQIRDTVR